MRAPRNVRGLRRMVRFNWPDYLVAGAASLAGFAIARRRGLPIALRVTAGAGAAAATWWSLASLVVGHRVYDRSALYRWRWLTEALPEPPERWTNVTAGLDESTLVLRELLGGSSSTLDLFDPVRMTEPSIHRARAADPPVAGSLPAEPGRLPLGDAAVDAAFVIFAAHELRSVADREAFFDELVRITRRGGHVLLVEHPRNVANLVAFGPGALHFFPAAEWRRLATSAGLDVVEVRAMTPFVRALVLRRR
jgi:hypothetical protein